MAKNFGKRSAGPKYTRPTTPDERELDKFDISEFLRQYDDTDFNEVEIGPGVYAETDMFSLLKTVHILAKTYGMGGCRSITEYINMIDEEEPAPISVLLAIITEEARVSSGFKPKKVDDKVKPIAASQYLSDTSKSKELTDRDQFGAFLINHGIPIADVESAKAKFVSGEVSVPRDRFEDITTEAVMNPNFDMKSALERLNKVKEQSLNFNIRPGNFGKIKKQ